MTSWKHRIAEAAHLQRRAPRPFGIDWAADVAALGPPPRLIFDVGANVGQTVYSLRRRFRGAHIHAFEPAPESFEQLARLASRERNVTPVQAALSDRIGWAPLRIKRSAEHNTLSLAPHEGDPTVTVPLLTIDEYVSQEGIETVDLIKIDTEGHEVQALRGARETLGGGKVRLVVAECDFHHRPGTPHTNFADLYEVMAGHGFRVVSFYCNSVDGDGWVWGDALFMLPTDLPSMKGSVRRWPPIAVQRGPAGY